MKYIRSYKLFESNGDLISNIKDILVELKDLGFSVKVHYYYDEIRISIYYTVSGDSYDHNSIAKSIVIGQVMDLSNGIHYANFNYNHLIKGEMERVFDYLKSEGYKLHKCISGKNGMGEKDHGINLNHIKPYPYIVKFVFKPE